MNDKRGQGGLEYVLLLGGILLVVVLTVVVLRGNLLPSVNVQLLGSTLSYLRLVDPCQAVSSFSIHPNGTNGTVFICRPVDPNATVITVFSSPLVFNGSADGPGNMTFFNNNSAVFLNFMAKGGAPLDTSVPHSVDVSVRDTLILIRLPGVVEGFSGPPTPTPTPGPDTTPPVITINQPQGAATYGLSGVPLQVTLNEAGTLCRFSADGAANTSMSGGPLVWTAANLPGLANGTHALVYFCSDLASNNASTSASFEVDVDPPDLTSVVTISPTANSASISFYTSEPANTTIYSVGANSFSTKVHATFLTYHPVDSDHTLTDLNPSTLYSFNLTNCDVYANCNTTGPYSFNTSNTVPTVTLTTPPNGTSQTQGAVLFNYTPRDNAGFANATLFVNSTGSFAVNVSNTTVTNNTANFFTLTLSAGYYIWNVLVCDNQGACSFAVSNFTLTLTTPPPSSAPTLTLVYPSDNELLANGTMEFYYWPIDNSGFSNATLFGNFTGSWAANVSNSTAIVNDSDGDNYFTLFLPEGTYLWNVQVCDNQGFCSFAPANFTLRLGNTPPEVGLVLPGHYDGKPPGQITFTYSLFDDRNSLKNATFFGNFTGTFAANSTNSTPLINNAINSFTLNLSGGTYLWGVVACDTDNLCSTSSNHLLFVIPHMIIAGYSSSGGFGNAISIGRANADSTPDLVVGAYTADTSFPTVSDRGRIQFYAGLSLALGRYGTAAQDYFTISVAAGDVNGDGIDEAIGGAYLGDTVNATGSLLSNTGYVQVYTLSGTLLYQFNGTRTSDTLGYSVAAGDVNGDGKADIVAGTLEGDIAYAAANEGYVRVFNGSNGALLYQFNGTAADQYFGSSVATGDVNGDGKKDIVASASAGAYAKVFDGATGSLLYTFPGINGHVTTGDVNGDTKADIVAANGTHISVFNGADGLLLYSIPDTTAFDGLAAGDVNGDGKADVATTVPVPGGYPLVKVYNSTNAALLFQLNRSVLTFGDSLAVADFDQDGFGDVYVGRAATSSEVGLSEGSAVYVYSGD